MRVAVPYTLTVYCEVDTETGEVERVVTDDENIVLSIGDEDAFEIGEDNLYHSVDQSAPEVVAATEIAQGDEDWPPWTRGY